MRAAAAKASSETKKAARRRLSRKVWWGFRPPDQLLRRRAANRPRPAIAAPSIGRAAGSGTAVENGSGGDARVHRVGDAADREGQTEAVVDARVQRGGDVVVARAGHDPDPGDAAGGVRHLVVAGVRIAERGRAAEVARTRAARLPGAPVHVPRRLGRVGDGPVGLGPGVAAAAVRGGQQVVEGHQQRQVGRLGQAGDGDQGAQRRRVADRLQRGALVIGVPGARIGAGADGDALEEHVLRGRDRGARAAGRRRVGERARAAPGVGVVGAALRLAGMEVLHADRAAGHRRFIAVKQVGVRRRVDVDRVVRVGGRLRRRHCSHPHKRQADDPHILAAHSQLHIFADFPRSA